MRLYASIFVLITAFLCGCSSDDFKTGHGDAGRFILQQAFFCGAHQVTANGLPAIDGRWRYFVDTNGMVMQLPQGQFSQVSLFLRQAFGPAEQEPVDTKHGKLGWYAAKTIGIGILFGYDSKHTQVIVLRPQTMNKIFEITMKGLQKKK